jgi:predicted nucleic acid-binding protein
MMTVLDTSAMMRLYIPDGPLPEGLEEAMHAAERGDINLIAPELALAEAAQVLHKKHRQRLLSANEATTILDHLLLLPIKYMPHAPLLVRATALAQMVKLTVYDALFLALAERYSARLITADETLRAAAHKCHLL